MTKPGSVQPLIVAMAVVVSTFIATLWSSQVSLGAVQDDARTITANAVPALEHLASARAELFRLRSHLGEDLATPSRSPALSRAQLDESGRRLEDHLAVYAALPNSPGEEQLAEATLESLRLLMSSLDGVLAGGPSASQAFAEFRVRTEDLATDLRAAADYNGVQLRKTANRIISARRTAAAAALGFGLLGVLAVAIATFLVARTSREQFSLSTEHRRVLEIRAAELEAFAGRVAHDLKSPLHSIALRSILAARLSGMPARGREFFEHVVRQLSRMNAIIEALLAFARAAANPDRTARAPLQAAVDGVVEEVREDARRQGVELAIGPVPRCSLACSEGVLSSVLSNLVRNALKYIGGGTGERRIALRARDVDGAVRVIVEDTGPGLPAGAEKAIFEPFVRLHAGRAPGLGLGLATVKRLIEAHGGHVGVDSTPGRGARFWFELPATADADPLDGRQVARAVPG